MLKWFTGNGEPTNLIKIIQTAKDYVKKNGKVYVGTDSFISQKKVTFASTVCLHGADGSRGGQYFFKKETLDPRKFSSLRQRIFHEVQNTINIAMHLYESGVDDIEIHLDISPSDGNTKTSKMADAMTGYARGVGFECKVKPEAWAAASVADKHSK